MQKVQKVESFNIQRGCRTTSKREQTHQVCLDAVEKYEKVESITTQNDYKTTTKKWTDKKKTNLLCEFCKSV